MGMYALIEDAQHAALEAANCWHQTDEAKALIEKADAFEVLSDRWCGECPQAAKGFAEAAFDAEDALEDLRGEIVCAVAREMAGDGVGDAYDAAWEEADNDAQPAKQVLADARRTHAGDDLLRRFGA